MIFLTYLSYQIWLPISQEYRLICTSSEASGRTKNCCVDTIMMRREDEWGIPAWGFYTVGVIWCERAEIASMRKNSNAREYWEPLCASLIHHSTQKKSPSHSSGPLRTVNTITTSLWRHRVTLTHFDTAHFLCSILTPVASHEGLWPAIPAVLDYTLFLYRPHKSNPVLDSSTTQDLFNWTQPKGTE